MNLPFTAKQFLEVFRNYNESIFPLQILFYLFALIAIYLAIRPSRDSGIIISAVLALLWLWTGSVYHIVFFSAINKAAYGFGAMFILQSVLFLYYGVFRQELLFRADRNLSSLLGYLLIVYALIIYPILGYSLGHVYPASPTFGLPCPTTIFTFGILLMNVKKWKFVLFIIPFLWSVIGLSAAIQLGMHEDIGLIASAALVLLMFFFEKKNAVRKFLA